MLRDFAALFGGCTFVAATDHYLCGGRYLGRLAGRRAERNRRWVLLVRDAECRRLAYGSGEPSDKERGVRHYGNMDCVISTVMTQYRLLLDIGQRRVPWFTHRWPFWAGFCADRNSMFGN